MAIDIAMQNSPSQQIAITLDDTDGSLEQIFDTCDIHKRPVRVYQWFTGLDLSDRSWCSPGASTPPWVWNERDRTVKFTALPQIEDKEIGFSAEEGQFPYIPAGLVGKAWPMIFGTGLRLSGTPDDAGRGGNHAHRRGRAGGTRGVPGCPALQQRHEP